MRRILLVLTCILFAGCSLVPITEYVPDLQPYQRKYYANYENVLQAVRQSLQEDGWHIEKEADPSIYELTDEGVEKRLLIITAPRGFNYGIGSHQQRINVRLLGSEENTVEVEIRHLSLNKITIKELKGYQYKKKAERILNRIGELVK